MDGKAILVQNDEATGLRGGVGEIPEQGMDRHAVVNAQRHGLHPVLGDPEIEIDRLEGARGVLLQRQRQILGRRFGLPDDGAVALPGDEGGQRQQGHDDKQHERAEPDHGRTPRRRSARAASHNWHDASHEAPHIRRGRLMT